MTSLGWRSYRTSLSKFRNGWLDNLYVIITSFSDIPNKLTLVEKCVTLLAQSPSLYDASFAQQ